MNTYPSDRQTKLPATPVASTYIQENIDIDICRSVGSELVWTFSVNDFELKKQSLVDTESANDLFFVVPNT